MAQAATSDHIERADAIIIGAGPAGLAVAACLRRAGREFVILERSAELASSWRRHYERLHLHTAKRYSSLPFRPFPRGLPRYVPRQDVIAYLEDYARAFDLQPRYSANVTRASRVEGGWRVEAEGAAYAARNLVIATGVNASPLRPTLAGEAAFGGTILHSAEYRDAEPYRGKRVLVVGAGNTGAEIALDLSEHGAHAVDLCVRGPIHVVKRDLFGRPSQVTAILSAWIPAAVRDVVFRWLVALTVGDLSRYGIQRPREGIVARIDRLGRIPLIDIGTIARIKSGQIRVRPDIRELTSTGARFADDSAADYDAIVLATGYKAQIEAFLDGASEVLDDRGRPRRHGREAEIRGLYFVGFHNVVTGLLREIGLEARRVARAIGRS
jgi:cation diffusion facilitator CzcD-associated flavoprotein CzcO